MLASRVSTLFNQGDFSLLEMMRGLKDIPAKARFLCVLIKSFLSMAQNHNVLDQVARPHSRLTPWAPWMLKFLFRFQTKCANESRESNELISNQTQINQAILASHAPNGAAPSLSPPVDATATAPSPPAPKGSYLVVFGESEEERENTWAVRSEQTFQMLQQLLESVNANINQLMPEDTFDDPSAMQVDSSTAMDADLGVPGAMGPVVYDDKGKVVSELAAQGGAMTDEEFAAYMETANF
jgi:hypothetical protein